ncbi:MAG: anti-sigma factor [Bacteroidetes bacterium]|nr:anti-sigma factor [Bacteroidota bacterium]
MDIKQYIESGILEQYVLGDLSDKDRKEVESMAAKHPQIREEIDQIELALETFAMSAEVKPSKGVYEGIVQKINAGGNTTPPPTLKGGGTGSLLAGFFGFLALVGFALAAYFYYNWNMTTEAANVLQNQVVQIQSDCDTINQQNTDLQRQLNILRNTDNESFFMLGSDLAPEAIAAVYVNPQAKTSYLDILSLPEPPTDKQYQLWALVDGVPVDMGVFDIDFQNARISEVPYVENAGAYAVTLEPRGGSVNPTLDQLYMISQS